MDILARSALKQFETLIQPIRDKIREILGKKKYKLHF